MLIAFWSPFSNASTTANTIAISAAVSMNKEHQIRSLLLHSTLQKSLIEHAFKLKEHPSMSEKGLVAVNRLAKLNLLKPHTLQDYSDSVIKNRLDVLSVYQDKQTESIEWDLILNQACKDYSYVFLDVESTTD